MSDSGFEHFLGAAGAGAGIYNNLNLSSNTYLQQQQQYNPGHSLLGVNTGAVHVFGPPITLGEGLLPKPQNKSLLLLEDD